MQLYGGLQLNYIFGNPPFAGRRSRTEEQKHEVALYFKKYKDVDYVACWIKKATQFIKDLPRCEVAFVATNSVTQGEQVYHVWQNILNFTLEINFAYRTFKWENEARGKAAVHCVIVGFSAKNNRKKIIFNEDLTKFISKRINPYFIDAENILVAPLSTPISDIPTMQNGNVPLDGDALKIEEFEIEEFKDCKYVKRLMGGEELLNNKKRYVLWLTGISMNDIKDIPCVVERVNQCRNNRLHMKDRSSQALASRPMTFRDTNNPTQYIAIPMVSSEKRKYIPMTYLDKETIPTNQLQIIPNATLYHFGILTSAMHMAWMRTVCGRLKSDYRYSASIVYNTFPWPETNEKQRQHIEELAQEVLDIREMYPDMTLAQLYNPETMPEDVQKAHTALDLAVDKLYQKKDFASDDERLQLLFGLYAKLVKE